MDGFELSIGQGEFVTLLGPSGCGKTTTLRMIAGFEHPTEGVIELDGEDMVHVSPDKRPMAMVFQSYALFPHMSVRDNVAYGLRLKRLPRTEITQEVDYALESMDLTHLSGRAPNQLSGGQQQRVALARAMVMKPKVLLFDEPLSNLDAKLRVQMRAEIRRLQQRLGITSIYVTHDQDEAMMLSDRIVVMRGGLIEQVAPPATIYRHPSSTFVADFIGRANFLPTTRLSAPRGGRITVRCLGRNVEVDAHSAVATSPSPLLLVRPESMRVTRSDARLVEGDLGRVLSVVFYGSVVEYELETDAGNIVAVLGDPEVNEILAPGDLVQIAFNATRAWLLPAAGAA
ncbi:ABC transporter ATP-binding protein [Microbacterium keratanolyticum]